MDWYGLRPVASEEGVRCSRNWAAVGPRNLEASKFKQQSKALYHNAHGLNHMSNIEQASLLSHMVVALHYVPKTSV